MGIPPAVGAPRDEGGDCEGRREERERERDYT